MPPFKSMPWSRTRPAWLAGARANVSPQITDDLPESDEPATIVDAPSVSRQIRPSSVRPSGTEPNPSSGASAAGTVASNDSVSGSPNDQTIRHDVPAGS